MTKFEIDKGGKFGTWTDSTSRLMYYDAMPALLNGIDTSGTVADYGGANGLLKNFIPTAISIDCDATKHPDIVADVKTHIGSYNLVVMRYLLHYLSNYEVTSLFNHLWQSCPVNRILVIQFCNEDLNAKLRNSVNETKHFRTETQLTGLFGPWLIKQTKRLSYVVGKEFYRNRLEHPNPTSHEETIVSIELTRK